jgi:hypothetical protein
MFFVTTLTIAENACIKTNNRSCNTHGYSSVDAIDFVGRIHCTSMCLASRFPNYVVCSYYGVGNALTLDN